jgi:hypothetical protein
MTLKNQVTYKIIRKMLDIKRKNAPRKKKPITTHAYIVTPSVTPRTVIVTRFPITIPTTAASDIVMPAISVKQTFNYATISVHSRMQRYDGY